MDAALATARKMMPHMPDEVFDGWLGDLIEDSGVNAWPFTSVYQSTYGTKWAAYFAGHSIKTISELTWKRQQIPRVAALFSPAARQILQGIIQTHIHGRATSFAKIKQGKGRESFFRSRQFIERTGCLHTPPVLIQQIQGYEIMDGNHRLAAAFSIPRFSGLLDCWVGHSAHYAA